MASLPPIKASASARDLILKLDDSCNCSSKCCTSVPKSPCEQKVYINKLGQAVKYNPKKSDEAQALTDSLVNLKNHIDQIAQRNVSGTEKVSAYILEITKDSIQKGEVLTAAQITRINAAVQSYLV